MRGQETRQDKVTWLNRRRSLGADPTARQRPTERRDQAPDRQHFPKKKLVATFFFYDKTLTMDQLYLYVGIPEPIQMKNILGGADVSQVERCNVK
jgi:hypothetical protein